MRLLARRRLDFSPSELRSYGGYCMQDVELTAKLFMILMQRFSVFELDLIDLTIRMFTEPVLVLDKKILKEHLEGINQRKKDLMEKVIHDEKDLRSSAKFAALLAEFGVEASDEDKPYDGQRNLCVCQDRRRVQGTTRT
jgi:hypothetical protein